MPIKLYTGGVRSGKSSNALKAALSVTGMARLFFATAVAFDDEMKSRIAKHQEERCRFGFETVEAPYDLAEQLVRYQYPAVAVVDCLTVWLGNQYYRLGDTEDGAVLEEVDKLVKALAQSTLHLFVVTNEVGWSVVPENNLARRFRDMAGLLNRRVAEVASQVTLNVCGLTLDIKK